MTVPPNLIFIAKEAQNAARNVGGRESLIFQRLAMVSMGVMALATTSQIVFQLLREINRKDRKERER